MKISTKTQLALVFLALVCLIGVVSSLIANYHRNKPCHPGGSRNCKGRPQHGEICLHVENPGHRQDDSLDVDETRFETSRSTEKRFLHPT